ncbi:peptidylprolyl isomerase [Christensenellaceae bacterium OttesenSCG-928-K19]|nr:peptidylprolyl isomerase [Christensenellaceae bacterium OttesenSCG-928-K19]
MKRIIITILCTILAAAMLASCAPAAQTETKGEPNTEGQQSGANSEGAVVAEIEMENGGVIVVELDGDTAPVTVENFVKLAKEGYYDGLIFHRVINDFMIQGGDPDGMGSGGPGYTIAGEFSSNGWDNSISHERGVISMARGNDPDSAGSQFFIVQGNNATYLDGDYAAFGHVTQGMDVVDEIASVQTDGRDKPLEDVVIKSIRILE